MYTAKVSVIGLGYVGLPVAVAMSRHFPTVAFDIDASRIAELQQGNDRTCEVTQEELKQADMIFTSKPEDLQKANFHIVAVPTPVDDTNYPDLGILLAASRTVGAQLKKGDIVVYESTVYPGATEEDCVPVLEKASGLKAGTDFFVGYSPERINPGDKERSFTKITKVVSGQNKDCLEKISSVYSKVVTAGVFEAQSIKVAEAAKVIENTQRDLNIALMNELAIIFSKMDIDTQAVLEAAGTKWNFLKFYPGLVGGHCIGVDPYYLTHKAEKIGYHPEVILAGRRINDSMGKFVAQQLIKTMVNQGHMIKDATVTILGLTFKENCPDIRNTKVVDLISELKEFGIRVQVCDPMADPAEALEEYGVELVKFENLQPATGLVLAVAHDFFKSLNYNKLNELAHPKAAVFDVKGILPSPPEGDGRQVLRL